MFLTGLFGRPFLLGDVPGEDVDASDVSDGGKLGKLPRQKGIGWSLKGGGADPWFDLGVTSGSCSSSNSLLFLFGESRLPSMLSKDVGGVICDQSVCGGLRLEGVLVWGSVGLEMNESGVASSHCSMNSIKLRNSDNGLYVCADRVRSDDVGMCCWSLVMLIV